MTRCVPAPFVPRLAVRLRALAWTGAVLATAFAAGVASAQELTPQQLAALRPKVTGILRQAGAPSADELKIIDDYFTKYFFRLLASDDPITRGQLAKNRKDLFTQFINVKGSAEARNHLLELTRVNVGRLAVGDYAPAVRYNAVLIIGQLDRELPPSPSSPPVPLPSATAALTAIVANDEFRGVPVPSSVKVAALVGLDRHTRFGVDPKLAEGITKAALAVATRTEAPADISPEVNDWMRRLAFRVLANQQAAGLTAPVSAAVAAFLADNQANLDDRCGVAELLTKEMFPTGSGVDPAAAAVAVGSLSKDVLTAEAKEARDYRKAVSDDPNANIGGGFGGIEAGYGGGFGGGLDFGGGMVDEGPKFEKRRLLERLAALNTATSALANAGGSDEVKQRMTDLSAILKTVNDIGIKPDTPDITVSAAVIKAAQDVNGLVGKWISADEPAGEEEAPEEDAFADAAADAEAAPAETPEADAEAAPAEAEPAAEAN